VVNAFKLTIFLVAIEFFNLNQYHIMPPIRSTPYPCPVCRKGYQKLGSCQRHVDEDHPEYMRNRQRATRNSIDLETNTVSSNSSSPPEDNFHFNNVYYPNPPFQFWTSHESVTLENYDHPDYEIIDINTPEETIEFPGAGLPFPRTDEVPYELNENSFFKPFSNEHHFNFAEWMVKHDISATAIDDCLSSNILQDSSLKESFPSCRSIKKKIDEMKDGLGWESWKKATTNLQWNPRHKEYIIFYYRNLIECTKWLLRQPYYKGRQLYAPVKKFENGTRVYQEMNTAEWWWECQVIIHW
jgi:Plavaka transposase